MRGKAPEMMDVPLSISGEDSLCSDTASIVAVREVSRYLEGLLGEGFDLIVTTPRKGSWIIDDFMKKRGLSTPHRAYMDGCPAIDAEGKDVLVFDDSIHSGKSVLEAVDAIQGARSITVGCILVNREAKKSVESKDAIRAPVRSMEIFDEYSGVDSDGHVDGMCQQYRYAYRLIPYIYRLSENRSPDFSSLVLRIESDDVDMGVLASALLRQLDVIGEPCTVDSVPGRLRISAELDCSRISGIFDEMRVLSMDQCKVRISCHDHGDWMEASITPMICPIAEGGSPDMGIRISGRFLDAFGDSLMEAAESVADGRILATRFDGVVEGRSWSSDPE